jgi:hypothetical protein
MYLVTVAPEEILGADVLVRILWSLRRRGLVGYVLPVRIPTDIAVDAEDEQARNGNAGYE